jgi:branched-chain amino acid transport system substrate-binding protein
MAAHLSPAGEDKLGARIPKTRYILVASLALLVVLLLAAWAARGLMHRPKSPIQIAVAMPLSGPQQQQGKSILDAIILCFDEVNQQGGVDGHPVRVVSYDDQDKPDIAVQTAKQIAASPAVAVIGHFSSSTTVPAGQIYKSAHLPAITAFAAAPAVTENNPYYFRNIADTSSQGHMLAAYAKTVLNKNHASVLYSDEAYGKSLFASFADEYADQGCTLDTQWAWDPKGSDQAHAALIQRVSDEIANGVGGVLVLSIAPYTAAKKAILLLRRTGVNPLILAGTSLGNNFAQQFRDEPEEKREPGFFTNNIYSSSPLIYDSSPDRALAFSDLFYKVFHEYPGENAAKHYETAVLLTEALRRSGVQLTSGSRDGDRERIKDWLATQNNLSHAVKGLTGPVYFDETQSLPQPARIGKYVEGRYISAPIQLDVVPNPALMDLDGELAAGHVIRIRQTYYWLQRVVYTGIDINQVGRVDPSKGTFNADFYLWFRYAGDDSVRDVEFNAATEKSPYDRKAPLLEQQINGMHYALYRVHGDFRSTFDFHDYPFDSQVLAIRLTNPRVTREQVIYAIDTFGLKLPRPDGGVSQLHPLSNWDFTHIRHEADTLVSDSTRGQPGAFHSDYETQFSGFNTVIGIKRKTTVYLFKNLLPLLLLVLVVYVTLYFPSSLLKERLTIAISAMLASAVLLTAINSQLTDVGYTTAIEYGFYGFFGLCIYCVLAALTTERLHHKKNSQLAERFDLAARIVYPLITLSIFAAYYVHYY